MSKNRSRDSGITSIWGSCETDKDYLKSGNERFDVLYETVVMHFEVLSAR